MALVWGVATCAFGARVAAGHPLVLFGGALLVRAVLVGTPPLLSDDLYRYLWEGRALAAGFDVFTQAPATIPGLDDALRARVNHPEVPSVYPPLALLWFRALALAGTTAAVQGAAAVCDATVPLSLLVVTRRPGLAWVYALHPLPALEAACGGHVDVPAVALAAAGLAAWTRGRRDLGFAALVAGALTKLFPLVVVPILLRAAPPRRAAAWIVAAVSVVGIGLAAVWPDAWPAGIGAYAERWAFNGLVYPWLAAVVGPAARIPLAIGAGAATAWIWARVPDPARAWWQLGLVFLATSPTVHPWYALWALVPGLASGRVAAAWAAVPLLASYTVLWAYDPATGAWSEAAWLWWVTWPPAVALLAVHELRNDATATEPYPPANSARNGNDAQ